MPIPVFYVDTSVVGGMFDREFQEATNAFWEQARMGKYRIVISPLVAREISDAPEHVRQFFDEAILLIADPVELTAEMEELAEAYVCAGAVSVKYRDDALHVAAATLSRARVLVSWNYSHLVNIRREDIFNAVNLLNGYSSIRIVSPLEVIERGEEESMD